MIVPGFDDETKKVLRKVGIDLAIVVFCEFYDCVTSLTFSRCESKTRFFCLKALSHFANNDFDFSGGLRRLFALPS